MTLATRSTDEQRRVALLQAVGFDQLNDAQRELALAIANNYRLDPMLKHLVMIKGRPYITRDGLLHVAHSSGQLDGIETTEPTLDADGREWRATCSVYRKDMSRPFTYSGRYPAKGGGNAAYAPEMAVKVAECMSLRRAFDIAAPTLEEKWDDSEAVAQTSVASSEPASLTERIAARAESIAAPETRLDQPEITGTSEADSAVDGEAVEVVEPVDGQVGLDGSVVGTEVVGETPTVEVSDQTDGMSLEYFAEALKDVDKALVKSEAKRLYPSVGKFADLSPLDLQRVYDNVMAALSPEDQSTDLPFTKPELCGEQSPLSDATCTLDKGHTGAVHRAGLRESW